MFTPSHPTPTVINLPLAQARTAVDKVHMTLKEGRPVTSITVGAGDVVSQTPKPGVSQKEGSTVTVVLSGGNLDLETLRHWDTRARGVESFDQPGWNFTGRQQVLQELVAWLQSNRGRRRVLIQVRNHHSGLDAVR